jgi:hypothetical protein
MAEEINKVKWKQTWPERQVQREHLQLIYRKDGNINEQKRQEKSGDC